jgi:hypothetical protein
MRRETTERQDGGFSTVPDISLCEPFDAMRARTLAALAALAEGPLDTSLRLDAAAGIVVTARHVALLAGGGPGPVPELAARWDNRALTATEFAEQLAPAEVDRLLGAAPDWAAAALPRLSELRRAA